MKPPTAYSILKELGNDALHKYIYENIAEPTFDSHRITNLFPQDFRDYYERMLIAHADEGDIRNRNVIIANRIGIYLGRNSRDLQIEKIGEVTSTNMNGEETPTSFWRKLDQAIKSHRITYHETSTFTYHPNRLTVHQP